MEISVALSSLIWVNVYRYCRGTAITVIRIREIWGGGITILDNQKPGLDKMNESKECSSTRTCEGLFGGT